MFCHVSINCCSVMDFLYIFMVLCSPSPKLIMLMRCMVSLELGQQDLSLLEKSSNKKKNPLRSYRGLLYTWVPFHGTNTWQPLCTEETTLGLFLQHKYYSLWNGTLPSVGITNSEKTTASGCSSTYGSVFHSIKRPSLREDSLSARDTPLGPHWYLDTLFTKERERPVPMSLQTTL